MILASCVDKAFLNFSFQFGRSKQLQQVTVEPGIFRTEETNFYFVDV